MGDVDGDGDLDIVTGNDYEETVVYLNELMTDTHSITFVRAGHLEIISRDTFAVALADMDGDGDLDLAEGRDSGQERVYINLGRLDAAFTASPLTGTSPLNVEFADLSTGSIVAWTWDFGDDGTSGARHPAHVYQDAGLYTVSLTVFGIGGADTETKTGYVNVLSAGSYPPVAGINFIWYASAPGPAIQGQDLVYFNGSGRDADEGGSRIVAWLWSSNRDGPLSAQEDFSIEAAALSTGTHTIAFKVQDDEGDWSPEVTRTLTVQAPPPLEIRTLILVNYDRLAGLYGPSEADQVSTTLHTLATHAAVSGEVIQVQDDPAVAAAYAAWDADLLSSVKANAVAEAIRALIVSRWESSPYLEYLVLVGDDRVIPFRRVPDRTREPESRYTAVSASTTVGAALRDDMVLTDDYYADMLPNPPGGSGGPNLYIPDLGIGRLVETPAQMVSQINAFLASSEIVVDSAAVSGYDFVKDSAQAMCSEMQRIGLSADCLIGENWGATEFTALVLNTYHDIALINGHANHYLLGTPAGSLNAGQVAAAGTHHTGAIWANAGCHAGLNVPPQDAHPLDLAEAAIQLKALYVANTGYGWGYQYGIGLSERLMLNLAERLARGQSATVGQALVAAKHRYYLDDKGIDAYDEKILIENVLYGLPMYRYIVSGGLPLPPPVEEEESGSTSEGGLIVIYRSFVFSPCTRIDTDDGAYYALDGQVHAQEGEPLQPGYTADILFPGAAAHGLIFRGGSYADIRPFDPVIAQAMTETMAATEPVYTAVNWGPARFYALNRLGQRDGLSMLLGQYNPHRQTERLYSQQDFDVYYHTHSDDWTAPSISSVSYAWQAAGATVTVAASDASGIYAVAVAYTSENGVWESVYLQNDGQAWSGSLPIRGSTEFFVQVVDKAGNVAVDDNGGAYYGVWLAYLPLTLKGYR